MTTTFVGNLKGGLFAPALAFAFVAAGCGTHTSTLKDSTDKGTLQFAVMAGNSTCVADQFGNQISPIGTGLHQAFNSLMADVNGDNRYDVSWIVSCHRNAIATVYYATSDAPTQVFEATTDQFVDLVTDSINYVAQNANDHATFLAGHSYGGWLAMKAALAVSEDHEFGGVFTIDPISRVHCTFSNPGGCMSAPRDFTTEHRTYIRDRSMHWSNFYQTRTFYLRSSAITEADENLRVNATHTEIDGDPAVWANIKVRVATRLAMAED